MTQLQTTTLLMLFATCSVCGAAASDCLPLNELSYIAPLEVIRENMNPSNYYFCAASAPAQFQCQCPTASYCADRLSLGGRNYGECRCCEQWVYGLIFGMSLLMFVTVVFFAYACFCRGKWWCDGYHPPLIPYLPRRSIPQVAAAGVPIPSVFRGYRPSDFDGGPTVRPPATSRERSRSQPRNDRSAAATALPVNDAAGDVEMTDLRQANGGG